MSRLPNNAGSFIIVLSNFRDLEFTRVDNMGRNAKVLPILLVDLSS